jgi:YebC/PmpR family DNA-binding regulatory protein
MAGHSHFANIRRKKDANDAKKAKLNTILSREIRNAIGSDPCPDSNPKLKNAIAKAKSMGLPKENIERAIKSSDKTGEIFENVVYEAYWGNIAIIITAQTNNRARTGPEIKNVLTKSSGCIAEIGSALFLFENLGMVFVKKNKIKLKFEEIEEFALLECGASEAQDLGSSEEGDSGIIAVYFQVQDFARGSEKLTDFLEKNSKSDDFIEDSFLGYNSCSRIAIDSEEKIESFEKLISNLESLGDVVNVFHNADL